MQLEPLSSVGCRSGVLRLAACLPVCTVLVLVAPSPAAAQMMMNSTEHLSFDRPVSWALKYFTSATLVGGLETPRTQKPGSVSIGLEVGWLPRLTAPQQLVGYDGTRAQDLNKAPFFPRPRVAIALPGSLTFVVAVVPPVPMFGLKTKLLALALERPVYETPALAVGVRVYGQLGSVQGSYTCPARTVAFEPGSVGNPDGCQAASSDKATLRYAGGEASVAYRPDAPYRLSPHAATGTRLHERGLPGERADLRDDRSHPLSFSRNGGLCQRRAQLPADESIDSEHGRLLFSALGQARLRCARTERRPVPTSARS